MDNPYFFQMPFFLRNVHHSIWKLERILTLIIRKAKGLELMKIIFITYLNTFGSKVKIMKIENVTLTKKCLYICDRKHECMIYIYNIKSICSQNVFILKM
jgi:hypothetical protein